jgi:periplasmic protein TonB
MTDPNFTAKIEDATAAERQRTAARPGHAGRFALCLGLALIVHAGAVFALLAPWQEETDGIDGAPILVELAVVTAAPQTQQLDIAPGPMASETPPAPPQPKQTEDAAAQPPPPVLAAPLADTEVPAPGQTAASTEPAPKQIKTVEAPVPREMPAPHQPSVSHLASRASAPSAAAQQAARATAPSPGAGLRDDDALPNWKSLLLARLERSKRYPAQARGDHGVSLLAFSIDRQGGVHRARIARSSGSALLDEETLALLQRALPLPSPPPQMRGAQIAVTVPIRYSSH